MNGMTRDQQQRLRAAYEEFIGQASPEAIEEVEGLFQETSLETGLLPPATPPAAALSTQAPDGQALPVPVAIETAADCPEVMHFLAGLGKAPAQEAGLVRPPAGVAEALRGAIPVTRDGGFLGTGRYQLLDPHWVEAGIDWLKHLLRRRASFRHAPPRVRIANDAGLVLVGDWGTGFFQEDSAAERVARQIEELAPEITIHLGDIYYAGRRSEVRNNFLAHWPGKAGGSFAINSNHEMYTGGFGYFEELLGDSRFAAQKGNSYFALENDAWVIVGLDSAYHANRYRLYRRGELDDSQIEFLAAMAAETQGRRLMVLTHHQGLNLDSSISDPLWSQVRDGLGGHPAVWYWGHVHSGAFFPHRDGIEPRCCGYGGMPRARAKVLEDNPNVQLFESRLADDPRLPQRVVSGFAHLRLSAGEVSETFYDEQGRALAPGSTEP